MLDLIPQSNLYKLNSQGYRCSEFNDVNWSTSFAVMGCSRVFGESLENDRETVPGHLETISNINTINLGACGSGIDFILFNTMQMIESNFIPKAVFIVWPDPERFLKFKNNIIDFFGSWSTDKELQWLNDNNGINLNHRYASIIKYLWSTKNVPVITISHHAINNSITDTIFTEILDYAPDGEHWGPNTCKTVATTLYNLYEKSN